LYTPLNIILWRSNQGGWDQWCM